MKEVKDWMAICDLILNIGIFKLLFLTTCFLCPFPSPTFHVEVLFYNFPMLYTLSKK